MAWVQTLIAVGADVDARGDLGNTPLICASWYPHVDVIDELLNAQCSADPNIQNDLRETPLYYVCRTGKPDLVRALLVAGARPDARCKKGLTPLHIASQNGHAEACEILAACSGVDVNAKDENGNTPLHFACRSYYGNRVRCLEAARVLLSVGAAADAQNARDETPLHHAAIAGSEKYVCALLEAGAAVDVRDENGNTPLHLASSMGRGECVQQLLLSGADRSALNCKGETPKDVANGIVELFTPMAKKAL